MDLGLKGKVAIVTGGSEGIGKAAAQSMAAEGARVAICASALDLQPAPRKRGAGGVRHPWRKRKGRPYADNIAVFARTKKEAIEVRDTLIRALSRGPAGNLRFGKKEVVKATEGFEFLGYELRVVRGNAVAKPTDDNQQSVLDKFIGHMTRRRYDKARRCVTRWAPQFNLWPAIDEWLDWMLSEVEFAASQSGSDDSSEASVARAVTPNRTPPPRIRRRPIVNADIPAVRVRRRAGGGGMTHETGGN